MTAPDPIQSLVVMASCSPVKPLHVTTCRAYLWFILSMPIRLRQSLASTLNHTIVPARDKRAAAQFFARIFGLYADPKGGRFAPVRINDTLTLLFDDFEEFESHHYAFHVSDAEFDAIYRSEFNPSAAAMR